MCDVIDEAMLNKIIFLLSILVLASCSSGSFNIDFYQTTEATTTELIDFNNPYFDSSISSNNITAVVGKSAFLRCKARNLGNKTVSTIHKISIKDNFVMNFDL